jgi:ATPase family associated with various cellular activities (AAA)
MNQQGTSNTTLESQLLPVLLNNGKEGLKHLLYYQVIVKGVPVILKGTWSFLQSAMNKRMKRHIEKVTMMSVRQKTSSVILQRDYEKDNDLNLLFDAVLSYVSELPQTKHVKRTTTGVFIMATNDEIEISPCIFVRKVGEVLTNEKISKLTIEVYSYTYDLGTLRKYMEDIEEKYQMAMSNQLGKNIFYFDEIPFSVPVGLNRKPDLSKAPPRLVFSKYPLHTNKSLKNIYGDSVKVIRKRVDFFVNNKRWYEQKGVPYTLGLLLHGVPGAGKTSCIKSIAKDTNRHVLNIRLSESTTVNQLNALFYSSQVQVVQNGENKFYDIPIEKRIIVLEDVDCLTDVVLSREAVENNKVYNAEKEMQKAVDTKSNEYDTFGRLVQNNDDYGKSQKLNLSILLNILDGVLEQPGRILIMTSNHPEKLDKALIRPGRIDVIVNFDYCKRHEVVEIIEAFTGKTVHSSLVCKIADAVYTPAEVTRVIFEHIESIDDIVNNLTYKAQASEIQENKHINQVMINDSKKDKEVEHKSTLVSETDEIVFKEQEDINHISPEVGNNENSFALRVVNKCNNEDSFVLSEFERERRGFQGYTQPTDSNFDVMFGGSNKSYLDEMFNTSFTNL